MRQNEWDALSILFQLRTALLMKYEPGGNWT